jgi:hypothetical protein
MAKITKTVEVKVCEVCDAQDVYHECTECGRTFCYTCGKTELVTYKTQMNFCSIDNPEYCLACNTKLRQHPTPEFSALLKLRMLDAAYQLWMTDMRAQVEEAEKEISALRAKGTQ